MRIKELIDENYSAAERFWDTLIAGPLDIPQRIDLYDYAIETDKKYSAGGIMFNEFRLILNDIILLSNDQDTINMCNTFLENNNKE